MVILYRPLVKFTFCLQQRGLYQVRTDDRADDEGPSYWPLPSAPQNISQTRITSKFISIAPIVKSENEQIPLAREGFQDRFDLRSERIRMRTRRPVS